VPARVVWLVHIVHLVPEGVLDVVAALLVQAAGDDGVVGDVDQCSAQLGGQLVDMLCVRPVPFVGAATELDSGADIAEFGDADVAVVVGDAVGVGDTAGGFAEQR
jgi:hypothetical protein